MQHEPLAAVEHHLVDDLLVAACGTQRDDTQALRFATREQRRPMRPRQYADGAVDGSDLLGTTTVQTDATFKDLLSHVFLEQCFHRFGDGFGPFCTFFLSEIEMIGHQSLDCLFSQATHEFVTGLLGRKRMDGGELAPHDVAHLRECGLVLGCLFRDFLLDRVHTRGELLLKAD